MSWEKFRDYSNVTQQAGPLHDEMLPLPKEVREKERERETELQRSLKQQTMGRVTR
jgi:hypothetical protein